MVVVLVGVAHVLMDDGQTGYGRTLPHGVVVGVGVGGGQPGVGVGMGLGAGVGRSQP